MGERPPAAVVTVGTELVAGLRQDTNATEVCAALTEAGYRVRVAVTLGDDPSSLECTLRELCSEHAIVVTTGGLGPTHDDVTREAAAAALGLTMARDPRLVELLAPIAARHADSEAAGQIDRQADVIAGSRVLRPVSGTAPGQIIPTPAGVLVLLPGPPSEMRLMLALALQDAESGVASVSLGVAGMPESDAQVLAERALSGVKGVRLVVLASPGDVRLVLLDDGGGLGALQQAREAVAEALGDACYGGASLAETVLSLARERGLTLAVAESCTGGLLAGALTDVPGSSDVFAGGVVAYADQAKTGLLGVDPALLEAHGAVSEQVSRAMAEGVLGRLEADLAVAITGIAGPSGGSPEKPVGLVWFALAGSGGTRSESRVIHGDRERVRARAVTAALNLMRVRIPSG